MSPEIQTFIALGLVALATTWLVLRLLKQRKNPGCGGDCGCPASDFKAKLRH